MNTRSKGIAHFLTCSKPIICGFAVCTFVWLGLQLHYDRAFSIFYFREYIFVAALLLVAVLMLLWDKLWSNLAAAVLAGFFPVGLISEFLLFPHKADLPAFGSEHFKHLLPIFVVNGGVNTLFLSLALMVLARAVIVIMRSKSKPVTSRDA